jgi:hypothetical protein
MRIVLLPKPEGDVIAREDQMGSLEGEFYIGAGGCVLYRHPSDKRQWRHVNRNIEGFHRSAEAFNRYCEEVVKVSGEAAQRRVVDWLRTELSQIEPPLAVGESFWKLILEQAEMGLL